MKIEPRQLVYVPVGPYAKPHPAVVLEYSEDEGGWRRARIHVESLRYTEEPNRSRCALRRPSLRGKASGEPNASR